MQHHNNCQLTVEPACGFCDCGYSMIQALRAQVTALETDRDVLSHSREALVVVVKELRDQLAAQGGPGGG